MSANSVADTQLGLTAGEIQILRQQQQVMAQRSHQGGNPGRGREQSRHSQPSSRAVSAASSQGGPTRLILDPRHLQALQTHMDNLLRAVGNRINELEEATAQSINSSSDRHGRTVQNAEGALERMRRISAEIDKMEAEFEKISRIKAVVKRLRVRVEETEARLDRHSSNDRHSSHHASHHSSSNSNRVAVDRHRH